MNIGEAVQCLQEGNAVARQAWHGKGMRVYLHTFLRFEPCLVIVTPNGEHQPGWVCSQADLLAEDWHTVPRNGGP